MTPLRWPFVMFTLVLALAVVALATVNGRALHLVLWSRRAEKAAPVSPNARYAWLFSVTAFFSGPLAPLTGLLVALYAWWIRRRIDLVAHEAAANSRLVVSAALYNGVGIALTGCGIMVAVWLTASPG